MIMIDIDDHHNEFIWACELDLGDLEYDLRCDHVCSSLMISIYTRIGIPNDLNELVDDLKSHLLNL